MGAILCLLLLAPVDVLVNGRGPFRFEVDTGAQSSIIGRRAATAAGVVATTQVEVVTAAGSGKVPMGHASIAAGPAAYGNVELLIHDAVSSGSGDGVLGQSFLSQVPHLIERGKVTLDVPAPAGIGVPVEWAMGRPAIRSSDGRLYVLDSGASHVVLFGDRRGRSLGWALLHTNHGVARVRMVELTGLRFGDLRLGPESAAVAPSTGGAEDGLIPTRLFRAVHIDPRANHAVLVP